MMNELTRNDISYIVGMTRQALHQWLQKGWIEEVSVDQVVKRKRTQIDGLKREIKEIQSKERFIIELKEEDCS
jgi:hypothetical protein